jgi:hypothetical protein
MSNYILRKGVLSKTRCAELSEIFLAGTVPDQRPGYEHYPILNSEWHDPEFTKFNDLKAILELAYFIFLDNYEMEYNSFEMKRAFGNIMHEGAVNEQHDDDGDYYPDKPVLEKHYSCILMLSDDYEGGEVFFTHHNKEVRLEAGDLILFRGNAENLHGVRKVTKGPRVNLIFFFRDTELVRAKIRGSLEGPSY